MRELFVPRAGLARLRFLELTGRFASLLAAFVAGTFPITAEAQSLTIHGKVIDGNGQCLSGGFRFASVQIGNPADL